MIKSMTGYGSAKGTVEGIEVSVELKSVNNKFLDTSIRLPRSFLFAEETIKQAVSSHISRGKVDVFVTIDSSMADDMVVRVNEPLEGLSRCAQLHCGQVWACKRRKRYERKPPSGRAFGREKRA